MEEKRLTAFVKMTENEASEGSDNTTDQDNTGRNFTIPCKWCEQQIDHEKNCAAIRFSPATSMAELDDQIQ